MSRRTENYLHSISMRHMATDFAFEVVVGEDDVRRSESVLKGCHSMVDRIESSLTEFREDSPVARWNRSEVGEWIAADSDLCEVLELSRTFSTVGGGFFTPFAKSGAGVGFDSVEIDPTGGRIRKLREGAHLGFGAIGKGYALDRVALELRKEGFEDFRLNCGGSSWIFSGFDPSGDPWEVAWAWDRDQDGDFVGHRYRLPGGQPIAIGVSGVIEKGNHFLFDGRQVESRVQSAFYCGRSGAEADALSTALLVGANREGEKILTRLEDGIRNPSFAYVDLEERMFYNQGFETHFLHEGRIR